MTRPALCKSGFYRMALAACVGISLIIASNAFAQNPPPPPPPGAAPAPPAAEAQRVIVTGSNIPTAEEVGPNPVLDYSHADINKSGEFTTEQFLLSLPIANANIIPTSNNENGSNRSEEHTSELQSQSNLVCRLLLGHNSVLDVHEDRGVPAGHPIARSVLPRGCPDSRCTLPDVEGRSLPAERMDGNTPRLSTESQFC